MTQAASIKALDCNERGSNSVYTEKEKLIMSKEAEVKKSATKQDPKATVKLSADKTGDPAFNQEHLHSARAKHLASNDQKIIRHPGQDSQHSKNTGTLNQE